VPASEAPLETPSNEDLENTDRRLTRAGVPGEGLGHHAEVAALAEPEQRSTATTATPEAKQSEPVASNFGEPQGQPG
jgi:hypothetical protein